MIIALHKFEKRQTEENKILHLYTKHSENAERMHYI